MTDEYYYAVVETVYHGDGTCCSECIGEFDKKEEAKVLLVELNEAKTSRDIEYRIHKERKPK